jgi:hypothetical protein
MSRGSRETEELTPLPVERGASLEPKPFPGAEPAPGSNRFWWAGALALVVAVVAGTTALDGPNRRKVAMPAPHPTPAAGADEAEPPGWRRGAAGPLFHRDFAAQVWTGTELVVWGGDPDGDSGAAYDPAADEWRNLAAAPIPARCQGASAWTGREVLVWGRACRLTPGPSPGRSRYATAGAAYDPSADRWRVLPAGPVEAGSMTTSVWTGGEWVLFNPVSPTVALEPTAGHWRILAPVPRPFTSLTASWTGREVVILGTEILEKGPSTVGAAYRHWTAAFDPATGRWRQLPQPPLELGATAVWDGRRLIAWDQNLNSVALDPAGGAGWKNLADLPLDFTDCSPQGARIGAAVFAEQCGQAALWRPRDETWERISHPKSLAEVPVWTGKEALFWIGRFAGSADGVWLYRHSTLDGTR